MDRMTCSCILAIIMKLKLQTCLARRNLFKRKFWDFQNQNEISSSFLLNINLWVTWNYTTSTTIRAPSFLRSFLWDINPHFCFKSPSFAKSLPYCTFQSFPKKGIICVHKSTLTEVYSDSPNTYNKVWKSNFSLLH